MIFILFCSFFNNFLLLKDGGTPLHFAAAKGFEQIVKILVEHGSNVHLQDHSFDFLFFLILILISLFFHIFLLLWVHCYFLFVKGGMDRSSLCCLLWF